VSNPWFRLYSEFSHDPKMQRMSEADQRRFVMLLCIRCSNGDVTLHDEDVTFQLRISNDEWQVTKALFLSKNLIDEHNRPVAWDKRQFASDSSAARVARHREKAKQACNVTVTPQIQNRTDTDTDTEQIQKKHTPKGDLFSGVSDQVAQDFKAMRSKQRAPITKTAILGITREADIAGISLEAALTICCERNWRGFKAAWLHDAQPRAATGYQNIHEKRADTIAYLTGRKPLPTTEKDITGESRRVTG